MTKLMIVESPMKASRLVGMLGEGWVVESTRGFVRDLPESTLGIDLHDSFKMHFRTPADKRLVVMRLKNAAKAAEVIYLATDPDREGEAMAWHIIEALKPAIKGKPIRRVILSKMTERAVQAAIAASGTLNHQIVESYLARRTIDRLVGYLISPLASTALKRNAAIGRVQGLCLRLLVEQEREIRQHQPSSAWELRVQFQLGDNHTFDAKLTRIRDRRADRLPTHELCERIINGLRGAQFHLAQVRCEERPIAPIQPFNTLTLIQAAEKVLKLAPDRILLLAQDLYEAGLITHPHTSSRAVSREAAEQAHQYIAEHFGADYLSLHSTDDQVTISRRFDEAIRPIDVSRLASDLESSVATDLYNLIWTRFVASQMSAPRVEAALAWISVSLDGKQPLPVLFQTSGHIVTFDGYLRVLSELIEHRTRQEFLLAASATTPVQPVAWSIGEIVAPKPQRYSLATLMQTLVQHHIGQISSYFGILKSLQDKGFIREQQRQLVPTEAGEQLWDYLSSNFADAFDYETSADLEQSLDLIAQGKASRLHVVREFWKSKIAPAHEAETRHQASYSKLSPLKTQVCPKCGSDLIEHVVDGRRFVACAKYPACDGLPAAVPLIPITEAR